MPEQNYLTLPTNLREAADDLPRLSTSEEYWRFRNLMTWAADRIDVLQAESDSAKKAKGEGFQAGVEALEAAMEPLLAASADLHSLSREAAKLISSSARGEPIPTP